MADADVADLDALLTGADHEQVVVCRDRPSGLLAVVAVHSTVLGPALGGTRYLPYPRLTDGVADVLRLSRAMTYKNAAAGLDLGGGKAVIVGDPATRSPALLAAYAAHLDRLGGSYLTAEDVGTTQRDMDLLRGHTRFVTGTSPELGGSGDPSAATAVGVFEAMRAVAAHLWGSPELDGRRVVVSGAGKVGSGLVRLLVPAGAVVTVADVRREPVDRLVAELGVAAVPADAALATDCDLLAPCALGGVLTPAAVGRLACRAVVGAANNQLSDDGVADALGRRGILYAPDFIVNAGGVINIADELRGRYDRDRAMAAVRGVYDTVATVLRRAADEGGSTLAAAYRLAEDRLTSARSRP